LQQERAEFKKFQDFQGLRTDGFHRKVFKRNNAQCQRKARKQCFTEYSKGRSCACDVDTSCSTVTVDVLEELRLCYYGWTTYASASSSFSQT